MSEKLRKILVMAAGVLVILETTVISGCHANISGTESDRMVEYTVICGDEIPEEFKKQINEKELEIKKNRGERICCECGKTVTDKTAAFCPFCGTKMEEVCADADDKQQTDEECAAENETSATAEPAAENSSDEE